MSGGHQNEQEGGLTTQPSVRSPVALPPQSLVDRLKQQITTHWGPSRDPLTPIEHVERLHLLETRELFIANLAQVAPELILSAMEARTPFASSRLRTDDGTSPYEVSIINAAKKAFKQLKKNGHLYDRGETLLDRSLQDFFDILAHIRRRSEEIYQHSTTNDEKRALRNRRERFNGRAYSLIQDAQIPFERIIDPKEREKIKETIMCFLGGILEYGDEQDESPKQALRRSIQGFLQRAKTNSLVPQSAQPFVDIWLRDLDRYTRLSSQPSGEEITQTLRAIEWTTGDRILWDILRAFFSKGFHHTGQEDEWRYLKDFVTQLAEANYNSSQKTIQTIAEKLNSMNPELAEEFERTIFTERELTIEGDEAITSSRRDTYGRPIRETHWTIHVGNTANGIRQVIVHVDYPQTLRNLEMRQYAQKRSQTLTISLPHVYDENPYAGSSFVLHDIAFSGLNNEPTTSRNDSDYKITTTDRQEVEEFLGMFMKTSFTLFRTTPPQQ